MTEEQITLLCKGDQDFEYWKHNLTEKHKELLRKHNNKINDFIRSTMPWEFDLEEDNI